MQPEERRYVILTEGYSDPVTAKTAACMVRYAPAQVVAVLDSEHAPARAVDLLDVGPDVPVVADLGDVPGAISLLIGTAPTGGRLPSRWRAIICDALTRGMHLVSGLHDLLGDDEEFARLAKQHGVSIWDVRRNEQSGVSAGQPLGNHHVRIHTVGHDCSIGKMVVTLELARALQDRGEDAKFLATGQTGILVSGSGVPIDSVVADFVSGAAERLVQGSGEHAILCVEGQGSLAHPMYSAVTLGLLHGCQPHGLILCYEVGREEFGGVPGRPLPSLAHLVQVYETMGSLVQPTRVIGVALNGRHLSPDAAQQERERVTAELGLPACDVIRDGPETLVQAVLALKQELMP